MILSNAALLTIVKLAACSNKQETKKETSNSQTTSKVTSKSSGTSKSKNTVTDSEEGSASSVVTDDDISKAKTVGDFKKLFAKLMDQTVSITEEAGISVKGTDKESYDATVSALKQEMENQKEVFNEALENIGSDSTVVPKEDREDLIDIIIDAKKQLEDSRKQMEDLKKELSKSPVADDSSDDSDSDSDE